MTDLSEGVADLVGVDVVVDTQTQMVYIGKLAKVDSAMLWMEEVDVHDNAQVNSSKELYIMQARKHGVKVNRNAARVILSSVVSVSRLEDVIPY